MTPEDASIRSERARQLLEDPLLKESLAANVNAAIAFCASAKDEKEAWRACMTLKAVMDATKSIATHMETEKIMNFNQKKRFGMF
jgi:hypothetical protein